MDNQKSELVKKLHESNNILVTVSSNPSVDQLSAAIGLTLLLNKLKKHATAVFSGQVPSTIEFLKPEDTIEKTTDSLRDFIISLDKSKADKLRYKVEDNVVKIFITPYKTSISDKDLDFSQGDFNVDVVLCLGVDKQQDLDQAITAHGRILHDATVAVVSTQQSAELGSLNWSNPQASSLSELAALLANELGKDQIDGQIATSFLTGIVAETDRFSNDKTSPTAMQLASELMAAGANQQLVASELEAKSDSLVGNSAPASGVSVSDDGTLEIGHTPESTDDATAEQNPQASEPEAPVDTPPDDDARDFLTTDTPPEIGDAKAEGESADGNLPEEDQEPTSRLMMQPPSMGGTLTANSKPEEDVDSNVDPLSMMSGDSPLLSHDSKSVDDEAPATADVPLPAVSDTPVDTAADPLPPTMPEPPAVTPQAPEMMEPTPVVTDSVSGFEPLPSEPQVDTPAPAASAPSSDGQSLADIEAAVNSPHVVDAVPAAPPVENLDAARDAVMDAINTAPASGPLPPTAASGAQGYLDVNNLEGSIPASAPIMPTPAVSAVPAPEPTPLQDAAPVSDSPADTPLNMPLPPSNMVPPADPNPPTSVAADPFAPPPLPFVDLAAPATSANPAPPVPPPLPFDFTQQKQ